MLLLAAVLLGGCMTITGSTVVFDFSPTISIPALP